jgi:hypothetical protein
VEIKQGTAAVPPVRRGHVGHGYGGAAPAKEERRGGDARDARSTATVIMSNYFFQKTAAFEVHFKKMRFYTIKSIKYCPPFFDTQT